MVWVVRPQHGLRARHGRRHGPRPPHAAGCGPAVGGHWLRPCHRQWPRHRLRRGLRPRNGLRPCHGLRPLKRLRPCTPAPRLLRVSVLRPPAVVSVVLSFSLSCLRRRFLGCSCSGVLASSLPPPRSVRNCTLEAPGEDRMLPSIWPHTRVGPQSASGHITPRTFRSLRSLLIRLVSQTKGSRPRTLPEIVVIIAAYPTTSTQATRRPGASVRALAVRRRAGHRQPHQHLCLERGFRAGAPNSVHAGPAGLERVGVHLAWRRAGRRECAGLHPRVGRSTLGLSGGGGSSRVMSA